MSEKTGNTSGQQTDSSNQQATEQEVEQSRPDCSVCYDMCFSPPDERSHRSAAAPVILPIDSIEQPPPFPLPTATNPLPLLTAVTSSSPRTAADSGRTVPVLAGRVRATVPDRSSGPPASARGSRTTSFRWGPLGSAGMAAAAQRGRYLYADPASLRPERHRHCKNLFLHRPHTLSVKGSVLAPFAARSHSHTARRRLCHQPNFLRSLLYLDLRNHGRRWRRKRDEGHLVRNCGWVRSSSSR